MTIAARAHGLTKVYGKEPAEVIALDDVSLDVVQGKFTAIMGPSGSGKSTLMHLMAGLDRPSQGTAFLGDDDIFALTDDNLTELRRDRVGFVFQAFNLVPTLTARENIVLPLAIAGKKVDEDWLHQIVDTLGLGNRLTHKPSQMSGGQQQRVACARALVTRPDIVFADEPTGNLDSHASGEVLAFLRESVDQFGQTIVIVTHDPVAAGYADRAVFLGDGVIIADHADLSGDDLIDVMRDLYGRGDPRPRIVDDYKPRRAAES